MSQTDKWKDRKTENEKQYFPTENYYTILWIFLHFHIPYINPVFYIIFCVKLLTSLEFKGH